jgi:hypothetical protein
MTPCVIVTGRHRASSRLLFNTLTVRSTLQLKTLPEESYIVTPVDPDGWELSHDDDEEAKLFAAEAINHDKFSKSRMSLFSKTINCS